jgi:hypothetical protein
MKIDWRVFLVTKFNYVNRTNSNCRSQWPRGLRRRSAADGRLRLWVRIPPRAWKSVCCEFCVLSGRGRSDGLIPRPEESYRLRCVVVCDLETWGKRRSWPTGGLSRHKQPKEKFEIVLCVPSAARWGTSCNSST